MTAEHFLDGRVTVYGGDSRDVLRTLPDASIDSIVTDPPYALVSIQKRGGKAVSAPAQHGRDGLYTRASAGFMGKDWDTGETAFAVEFWAEVMRVLKPGGHVVAFGGTRSFHRLVCAIEDAGFEIRDQLAWLYGTGFPKSHDVSKGIDKKRDDGTDVERVRQWLEIQRKASGLTRKAVNEALGLAGNGGGLMSSWTTNNTTACIPQWEQWLALKALLGFSDEMDSEVTRLNDRKGEWGEAAKARGTIETTGGLHGGTGNTVGAYSSRHSGRQLASEAVLPEAARWSGWGTALKPALEPICLARKPLDGTVAANVLRWGTGAINVDGCRVGEPIEWRAGGLHRGSGTTVGSFTGTTDSVKTNTGRWPANLVHDGSDEVVGAFPDSNGQQGRSTDAQRSRANVYGEPSDAGKTYEPRNDAGSAARFFYSAKADGDDRLASKHPTVKPVDLMRWLVRLVTPPGGVVLDPFAGTGTTGEAAWREGFRVVLIEREPDYRHDISRRLALVAASMRERKQERAKSRPAIDLGPLFTAFPEAAE